MMLFALSYKGIFTLQTESLNFHVYSLSFLVFTYVFTGFLFTTFPRFCQSEAINKTYYVNLFCSCTLGSFLFLAGSFLNHTLMLIGIVILFLSQIFIVLKLREIYISGHMTDKKRCLLDFSC